MICRDGHDWPTLDLGVTSADACGRCGMARLVLMGQVGYLAPVDDPFPGGGHRYVVPGTTKAAAKELLRQLRERADYLRAQA